MVRWSLIEEWLQLRDSRANPHFGVGAVQGNLEVKDEIHTLASDLTDCQNSQERDNCRRRLSTESGSVCGVRDSESFRFGLCGPKLGMFNGTYGRMEWIVASPAIKEANGSLGNAASLAFTYLLNALASLEKSRSLILLDPLSVSRSRIMWYTVEYQIVLVLVEYMLHRSS